MVAPVGSARFEDRLWGTIALDQPVLVALVQSSPVQRLRGIHQAGASYYLLPDTRPNTRFEHSLGVMHLLARLGAGLEEQIAGLLHDVPHTAFSHTADIVFPNEEHNYHELFQHDIIMRSEIPAILADASIPLRAALQPEDYPLLEQPLPDLCADRIDYTLRDLLTAGKITPAGAQDLLARFLPTRQGILLDDTQAALRFATLFAQANDLLWTGPDEAGAYWALAQAIKRAYEIGAFSDNDLFSTDNQAMEKLRRSGDEQVAAYLSLLRPGTHFYSTERPPFFTTHMKQRAVDPLVLEAGWTSPRRLSSISPEYARKLSEMGPSRNIQYRLWSTGMTAELQRMIGEQSSQ